MTHHSQALADFGARLREERERLGLTQVQFAKLAGVRRVAQYLYETGDRSPTVSYLLSAKDAGVDLTYLLLGKSDKARARTTELVDRIVAVHRAVSAMAVDRRGRPLPLELEMKLARPAYEALLRGEAVTDQDARFLKNLASVVL